VNEPAGTYRVARAREHLPRMAAAPGFDIEEVPAAPPGVLLQFRAPVTQIEQPDPICFDNRWQPHVDPAICSVPLRVGTLSLPVVPGARLLGPGLVFTGDDRLLDTSIGRHAERLGLAIDDDVCRLSGPLGELVDAARAEPRKWRVDDTALLLHDPAIHHFGMWMIKCLPRLAVFDLLATTDLPVLVPTQVPDKFLALMAALGVGPERVRFHDPRGVTEVARLIVPPKVYTPGSCRYGQPFEPFRAAAACRSGRRRPGVGPARVYVTRRGNRRRRLKNEKAVETLFRAHGFEVAEPGGLSAMETLLLFRDCDIVAGSLGSGLYNLLLSERAPNALALLPPVIKFDRLPATLTHLCTGMGGNAGFVCGRRVSGQAEADDQFDYDWEVDVDAVADALTRCLAVSG
jgi:hypothetical protein